MSSCIATPLFNYFELVVTMFEGRNGLNYPELTVSKIDSQLAALNCKPIEISRKDVICLVTHATVKPVLPVSGHLWGMKGLGTLTTNHLTQGDCLIRCRIYLFGCACYSI